MSNRTVQKHIGEIVCDLCGYALPDTEVDFHFVAMNFRLRQLSGREAHVLVHACKKCFGSPACTMAYLRADAFEEAIRHWGWSVADVDAFMKSASERP